MKIQNTTQSNKRIRLTALDSAMANIDDSTGAVAKDAKDVLICLSPMVEEIPSNEMHFTTLAGSADYVGQQGDQILLSDGTTVDVTSTNTTFTFNVPSGKHKVKLVESVDRSNYVSVGGGALVELHNFPTLSTVTKFNFATYEYNDLPNLTKVPNVFPSNITDIEDLFSYATNFNQDISMWNVSNVTNMAYMFNNASSFDQPLNNWNMSNVTTMRAMFDDAISFNQPLDNWNVSNVTNMRMVFNNASSFDQPLNNWNVSNVTTMAHMFKKASSFDQPLNNWDVSNVTDMTVMFNEAISFNQPLDNWNVSNVTDMYYMFNGASAFNQDLSQWCVSNFTEHPSTFDLGATSWTLPRPVWGTCPIG